VQAHLPSGAACPAVALLLRGLLVGASWVVLSPGAWGPSCRGRAHQHHDQDQPNPEESAHNVRVTSQEKCENRGNHADETLGVCVCVRVFSWGWGNTQQHHQHILTDRPRATTWSKAHGKYAVGAAKI